MDTCASPLRPQVRYGPCEGTFAGEREVREEQIRQELFLIFSAVISFFLFLVYLKGNFPAPVHRLQSHFNSTSDSSLSFDNPRTALSDHS